MKMSIASLSLLTVCCLMLAVAPAMADATLYSNGSYNGHTAAWAINAGNAVSDSFTVPSGSSIEDLAIVYWVLTGNPVLTSVDMSIGSTSFGGTPQTLTSIFNGFLLNNGTADVYEAVFAFTNIPWSGAGWLTLQNACTTAGCSFSSDTVYWDENDGPSLAWDRFSDKKIGSESFTLTGTTTPTTPEPSSLMLFGSGILGLAGILRKKVIG